LLQPTNTNNIAAKKTYDLTFIEKPPINYALPIGTSTKLKTKNTAETSYIYFFSGSGVAGVAGVGVVAGAAAVACTSFCSAALVLVASCLLQPTNPNITKAKTISDLRIKNLQKLKLIVNY
jgi:hypothetical protein